MTDIQFVTRLSDEQILETQRPSQGIWGGGLAFEARMSKLRGLLELGPEALRVAGLVDVQSGAVISSLKRYRMAFRTSAEIVPAVGLGAIFTPEEHRRRGYAERLVRAVLEEAAANGAGFSLLYSDIGGAYYEKMGFRVLSMRSAEIAAAELVTGADEGVAHRAATDADAGALLAWHEKYLPREWAQPIRDERTRALFRRRNAADAEVILRRDGVEFGYVEIAVDKDEFWIAELCVPEEELAAAWSRIGRMALERGCTRVGGWLRADEVPGGVAVTWKGLIEPLPMLAWIGSGAPPAEWPERMCVHSIDYF